MAPLWRRQKYCDVILHVVDASDENWDKNIETVYGTLKQLKIDENSGKPVITVFNKIDRISRMIWWVCAI